VRGQRRLIPQQEAAVMLRDHIRRVPLPGAMPSGIDLMDAWCRSVRDAATGDSGALLAS